MHCRYSKLSWLKKANIIAINSALVRIFTFLRIAPAGIQDVHDMLVNVAQSLIAGGETGKPITSLSHFVIKEFYWIAAISF